MSVQYKKCPKCQQPAALDAPQCANCGRQFRTQFVPPDQTQMFSGPLAQTPPTPPAPSYAPTAPANGPLDDTERNVSMVWTGIGVAATGLMVYGGLRGIVEASTVRQFDGAGGALMMTLLIGCLFSFLVMRFRRLYLSAPGGAVPADIAQRRSRFSLVASCGIGVLVFAGLLWPVQRPPITPLEISPAAFSDSPPPPMPASPDSFAAPVAPTPRSWRTSPDPGLTPVQPRGDLQYGTGRAQRGDAPGSPAPQGMMGGGGMGGGFGGGGRGDGRF